MVDADFTYVYWTNAGKKLMTEKLTQLGLSACPICGSQSLLVNPKTVIQTIGGYPSRQEGEPHGGNVDFMLSVKCELCGYSMLFDSEKLGTDEEIPLWRGPGPPPD